VGALALAAVDEAVLPPVVVLVAVVVVEPEFCVEDTPWPDPMGPTGPEMVVVVVDDDEAAEDDDEDDVVAPPVVVVEAGPEFVPLVEPPALVVVVEPPEFDVAGPPYVVSSSYTVSVQPLPHDSVCSCW